MMRRKIISCPHTKYFMLHKVFYYAKLSNKQSAKVICTFDRLRTAYSNKTLVNLLSAHTFAYIVLRVNYGLTSCEDLAMALV